MDYYELLEVSPNARDSVIRAAWKRIAQDLHPDRNPSNADAHQRMQRLNEAKDTLLDPQRRAQYDRTRKDNPRVNERPRPTPQQPPAPPPREIRQVTWAQWSDGQPLRLGDVVIQVLPEADSTLRLVEGPIVGLSWEYPEGPSATGPTVEVERGRFADALTMMQRLSVAQNEQPVWSDGTPIRVGDRLSDGGSVLGVRTDRGDGPPILVDDGRRFGSENPLQGLLGRSTLAPHVFPLVRDEWNEGKNHWDMSRESEDGGVGPAPWVATLPPLLPRAAVGTAVVVLAHWFLLSKGIVRDPVVVGEKLFRFGPIIAGITALALFFLTVGLRSSRPWTGRTVRQYAISLSASVFAFGMTAISFASTSDHAYGFYESQDDAGLSAILLLPLALVHMTLLAVGCVVVLWSVALIVRSLFFAVEVEA